MSRTSAAPTSAGTASGSLREIHDRMILAAGVRARSLRTPAGLRVHAVESGEGPPLLHLHGSSTCCLSHLPLLARIASVRSVAVDRSGHGLSEPVPVPRREVRSAAVRFVDEVLDALHLESVSLAGASMGGTWAIWYALDRPDRVDRLLLLGSAPLLPRTRPPLALRAATTPVAGDLLAHHLPPSRRMVVRLMGSMGEGGTITRHPELLDSLVAGGRDPVAAATNLAELRSIITLRGFRRSTLIRSQELRRLAVPTLLVWGDHDPVGDVEAARQAARSIPTARLEVVSAGHVPWLGRPDAVSALVSDFMAVA